MVPFERAHSRTRAAWPKAFVGRLKAGDGRRRVGSWTELDPFGHRSDIVPGALRGWATRFVPPALRKRVDRHAVPRDGLELALLERERLLRRPAFPVAKAQVVLL